MLVEEGFILDFISSFLKAGGYNPFKNTSQTMSNQIISPRIGVNIKTT